MAVALGCAGLVSCNDAMSEAKTPIDGQKAEVSGSNEAPRQESPTELKTTKSEYRFDDYSNLPAVLFKPYGDSPQDYVAYMKDIDRAHFDLKSGKFADAAESFAAISKETLFESPNDAAWAGHAESLCRLGRKSEGSQKLRNAQCSLELLSNKRSCTDLDKQKAKADFPSDCYREYCEAEMVRPDYDQENPVPNTPDIEVKLSAYNRYLESIKGLCQ